MVTVTLPAKASLVVSHESGSISTMPGDFCLCTLAMSLKYAVSLRETGMVHRIVKKKEIFAVSTTLPAQSPAQDFP